MTVSVLAREPASWVSHPLHDLDRIWPESNCYVDLWIELLHALDLEPVSGLASTVTMDFEGDQWTFVKFLPEDLERLYGIVIKELAIWRGLADHVREQVQLGRPVIVEVDAFALPDTVDLSYEREHTKTAIAVEGIDIDRRCLRYFHNRGYYALGGPDFDRVLLREAEPAQLPPYVEIVDLGGRTSHSPSVLRHIARSLLERHVDRIPTRSPVTRFRARLTEDLRWLRSADLAVFHRYAFANFRQCGAASELGAAFLRWLADHGEDGLRPVALHLDSLATGAKTLQFLSARAVTSRRFVDLTPVLDGMEKAWISAMEQLRRWRARQTTLPALGVV
jgi:hypothetical protein